MFEETVANLGLFAAEFDYYCFYSFIYLSIAKYSCLCLNVADY